MKAFEKIRLIRELKKWSQEQMAEKLNISANGYAKIERGETKLTLPRLQQISEIFEINLDDLIKEDEQGFVIVVGQNNTHCLNSGMNFGESQAQNLIIEIEKLKLIVQHKDELLALKDRELAAKDEIIALLKQGDDDHLTML